jgi:hypothetical protein
MSDVDLQTAYKRAGALEAKELRAEIQRRENLVKPEPAAPAAVDSITQHTIAPVSMDIFEGGSGQLDIAGQVYDIHRDNSGRRWVADHLEGNNPGPSFTAATPADLARRVADHHGVTGPVSIEDERPGARATTRFEHTAQAAPAGPKRGSIEAKIEAKEKEIERRESAVSIAYGARTSTGSRIQSGRESKARAALSQARSELMALQRERDQAATPAPAAMPDPVSTELRERLEHFTPEERDQLRAEAQELRTARGETPAGAWRAVIEGAEQDRLSGTGRYARRAPATPAGVGPGAVPIGATDADRRAARPRQEGESDRAYEIRTAPSRFAAESLLRGNTLGGLRAFARAEGVVTTSSDSKAGLVERLMRALYDRHADSDAITRMVNRDRTPAPVATPAPAAPAGAVARLRAIPEAGQRSLGREPVADTVDRILAEVRDGGLTRTRAADQIAQLVQRFSINRGGPGAAANEEISALLARIAGDLRQAAPAPTLTGTQLLARRRAARG